MRGAAEFRPEHIFYGLQSMERGSLADLLALYEDTDVLALFESWLKGCVPSLAQWVPGEGAPGWLEGLQDFQQRLTNTGRALASSELSDDELRLRLWVHLRAAMGVAPGITFSSREVPRLCEDLAIAAVKANRKQNKTVTEAGESTWNKAGSCLKAWYKNEGSFMEAIKKIKATFARDEEAIGFDELVRLAAFNIIKAAYDNDSLDGEQKTRLAESIRQAARDLDDKQKARLAGILDGSLSDDELLKQVAMTGSGLIGFGILVNLSGFSAYLLAAQASAFIPLVGGQTLVSLVAVFSNPVTILALLGGMGFWAHDKLQRKLLETLSVQVITLLALNGATAAGHYHTVARFTFFRQIPGASRHKPPGKPTRGMPKLKKLPIMSEYMVLRRLYSPADKVSVDINKDWQESFDRPLSSVSGQGGSRIMDFLFPGEKEGDNSLLYALSVGDLLYDLAAIDPAVIQAADFYRQGNIEGVIDFSLYADEIMAMTGRSFEGAMNQLDGYVAEQLVAARLVEQGYQVSFPESATQPGYDLLVDGTKIQVKCLADLDGLKEHFSRYPDIPVLANAELHDLVTQENADWASQVFFIDGYTKEFVENLAGKSTAAGSEAMDNEIPLFATSIAAARNLHGWWKGEQSLEDAMLLTAVEGGVKGGLGIMGGFAGKTLGALVLGPAGAVVGVTVGGIFAASSSAVITDKISTVLDPDYNQRLERSACRLLSAISDGLWGKIVILKKKMMLLYDGEIDRYLKQRFRDDIQFFNERRADVGELKKKAMTGEQRAKRALALVYRCRVHPSSLQEEISKVVELLDNRPGVAEKVKGKIGRLFGRVLTTVKAGAG